MKKYLVCAGAALLLAAVLAGLSEVRMRAASGEWLTEDGFHSSTLLVVAEPVDEAGDWWRILEVLKGHEMMTWQVVFAKTWTDAPARQKPYGYALQETVVLGLKPSWTEEGATPQFNLFRGGILHSDGRVTGRNGFETTLEALREQCSVDRSYVRVNGHLYCPPCGVFPVVERRGLVRRGVLTYVEGRPQHDLETNYEPNRAVPREVWEGEGYIVLYPDSGFTRSRQLPLEGCEVWAEVPEAGGADWQEQELGT